MLKIITPIFVCCLISGQVIDNYTDDREQMVVSQIKQRGVSDQKVLEALLLVPRHNFVPDDLLPYAYDDYPLPIGYDQTISQPYIVAYMTELLQVDTNHIVLEIGTGSGYQAAVLAHLSRHVYTIEIVPELGQRAANLLKELAYDNITVRIGDGYLGWPEVAPFDRIIVTAAPEEIPPELLKQLKPGGRMILPVGPQWWAQELLIVSKDKAGNVRQQNTIPVRFVPMIHGRD
ncbi:MAG: protein-L-isoaspartate(D-aspartate) O-methyltransferase [Candidatus Marinimicrobia bacterium]|nr:protein-L-isoaspartate(D-aspartate) O-methyltransferase [Candidatus Neomarinimicrobiota bacterium]